MKLFSLIYFINFIVIILAGVVQENIFLPKNFHAHPPGRKSPNPIKNILEETAEYWQDLAQASVTERIKRKLNENVAKNIVFFLGDGMGISTITAARNLIGGEQAKLAFEEFPYTGLSKTYCVNLQVADSACTATAYLTGIKNNGFTLGVNGKVKYNDCVAGLNKETHTRSLAKWAVEAGKSAGFVTTTRVTHASPGALYAHVSNRMWEDDTDVTKMGCSPNVNDDIAEQLIYGDGRDLSVILGGGRRNFLSRSIIDEEGFRGSRNDSKNLIKAWINDGRPNKKYVWNRKDLLTIDPLETDYLLGLFENDHMMYHLESKARGKMDTEPTLAEMTEVAIEVLRKNENGFFLFVEGGRIDHGHHETRSKVALDETVELSKAVKVAKSLLSDEDTLFIVTSDHSHTMSISGYPYRGNNIFGITELPASDGLSYMTLSYANGPQIPGLYDINGKRVDPATVNKSKWNMKFPSIVNMTYETHAGEDVAIFAHGPFAHLFTGNYDQNIIPHLAAYAACIGDGLKACDYY